MHPGARLKSIGTAGAPRADGRGYDFAAPTRFDRLFAGLYVSAPAWMRADADLRFDFDREETCDADYARLLEGLFNSYNNVGNYGKAVASPIPNARQLEPDRLLASASRWAPTGSLNACRAPWKTVQ